MSKEDQNEKETPALARKKRAKRTVKPFSPSKPPWTLCCTARGADTLSYERAFFMMASIQACISESLLAVYCCAAWERRDG